MKNNCNGCVTGGLGEQKTMCDTLSTATPSFPRLPYGSPSKFTIETEKSITEPDNGHKTESISPKLANYKVETERFKTFENWTSDVVRPADLARSGFYYLNNPQRPDLVKCAFCNVEICNWEAGDDALGEHVKWSPNCPYVLEKCLSNPATFALLRRQRGEDVCGNGEVFSHSIPESETFRRLTEMTKNYDDEKLRLESFANWPKSTRQDPEVLAGAGFYYRGVEDHTICFSCGGALKDWVAEDNAWEQHAMWFPTCRFLLEKKGQEYVDEVQRKMKPQVPSNSTTKEEQKKSEESERSLASQEVLLCKICDSNERNVIFRPCNHILACAKCSVLLQNCPVCRKPIEERMKVYLS